MGFDFVSFFPRAVMQGIPLLYGSTGEILTEKSGNLNLGIPGIMYVGAISGVIGSFFYEQAAGGDAQSLAGKVDGFFGLPGGFRCLFCRLHGEELCFQVVRSVKVVYLHLVLIPPHLRSPPSASYVTVRERGEAS